MQAESRCTDRARRLLAILPALRSGERLSLTALAKAAGATPGQLAEDLATLSLCGVPPFSPYEMVDVFVEGDEVVVYSDPPSLTRPVKLTAEESAALSAALEACGHGPDDPLARKLASASRPGGEDLANAVRTAVAGTADGTVHSIVSSAVRGHRVLRIVYQAYGRQHADERLVEPLALASHRGVWYLSAVSRPSGETRTFRLDRMLSAEALGETFSAPTGVSSPVAAFTREAAGLPVARVHFDPGSTDLEERDWPGARFSEEPDGSILAEIPYQGEDWICRRVLARLGEARVLEPASLRSAVARLAASMLARG